MAIRNIVVEPDELLRKKSKVVENIDEKVLELIDDMVETMYKNNGVGLAAVQVGILKRIAVVDIGEGPVVLINPEIVYSSGKQIGNEGCLSIPSQFGKVKRPKKIVVKTLDKQGKEQEIEARNFLARAMCHEIDHLDGILYTDKLEEE